VCRSDATAPSRFLRENPSVTTSIAVLPAAFEAVVAISYVGRYHIDQATPAVRGFPNRGSVADTAHDGVVGTLGASRASCSGESFVRMVA
jgi:hypothetical protein